MATIELTQPMLVGKIEQLASALQRPVQQVLEAAVQDYLDRLECEAIQQESDAYRSMHSHLVQTYPDQFVAIQGGEVVDHDADVTALEQRVHERFKWHPVLIAPLTLPAELRWRGARLSEKEHA